MKFKKLIAILAMFLLASNIVSCDTGDVSANPSNPTNPTLQSTPTNLPVDLQNCKPDYTYDTLINQGTIWYAVDTETAQNNGSSASSVTLTAQHSATVTVTDEIGLTAKYGIEDVIQASVEEHINVSVSVSVTASIGNQYTYSNLAPDQIAYAIYGVQMQITSGHLHASGACFGVDIKSFVTYTPIAEGWCVWVIGSKPCPTIQGTNFGAPASYETYTSHPFPGPNCDAANRLWTSNGVPSTQLTCDPTGYIVTDLPNQNGTFVSFSPPGGFITPDYSTDTQFTNLSSNGCGASTVRDISNLAAYYVAVCADGTWEIMKGSSSINHGALVTSAKKTIKLAGPLSLITIHLHVESGNLMGTIDVKTNGTTQTCNLPITALDSGFHDGYISIGAISGDSFNTSIAFTSFTITFYH